MIIMIDNMKKIRKYRYDISEKIEKLNIIKRWEIRFDDYMNEYRSDIINLRIKDNEMKKMR